MRKKWTYVAIVSMMLGVAPVFTGCVDTDEPAGLEELRGAKAELLKAKAQVQLALAEVEAANARYRDQETAWMKAKADYEAQVAREKELQNDLLEAKNEIEKQKAQAEYDAYLEELARQKELLDAQINGITDTEYENYKNRYLEILKEGNLEYKSDLKTNSYQQDERRLLTRLEKYVDNHLLFMKKFYVPFSNNRAEADLRFTKVRQKIGKFRSVEGATNFTIIRSFTSTCSKNKKSLNSSLKEIFTNTAATA